ncbi:PREDICTED: guanylate-binding protein 2-like isoform X3 [Gekko japonicus]|uniref:Guanylate-binding protein 2-like isoform X3 n=1 Tax=Gekko japonicus TaxID=146911 RepID=A0ABM1JTT9_GEKJA|nr:PREDICTED: guanylate-binding protein 2-like isoform X3 [Gekko japonicus]
MASRIHMPAPMCLIENKGKNLTVCPEALQVLSKINQPVAVVAIAGLYRTGKSYLMNRLAGENKGFLLGPTVQATTKGIWMWCVPYPGRPDQTLVLLDTEGLGDAKKGDTQNDSWIFALAVLLSSTLVYNSMGTIDQHAMDQLHYVTELTNCIKSKSSPRGSPEENSEVLEDSADYVRFFPSFIWAMRDFTLQLELNGQPCTEDEYLEDVLKLKKGPEDKVLAKLVETYVGTIRSGGVPCAESAVEALARAENTAALNEATARYVKLMEQKVKLPTESIQELLERHAECETEAHEVFMARAFKKDIQQFLSELVKTLHQKKEEYCRKNELESSELCKSVLRPLCEELEKGISQRSYLQSGGYQRFLDDLNKIKEQYHQKNGKGIMAEKVLQQFLKEKDTMGRYILQSDEALKNAEKELADAAAKAKEAEREKEVQKQEQAVLREKLSDQRRSFEASICQLKDKMEKDREELLKENEKMLDSKLREQTKFLEEKHQHFSARLQTEIDHLMQENQCSKGSSWIFQTVLAFIKILIPIFPEWVQFISLVLKS